MLVPEDLGNTPFGPRHEVETACVAAIEIANKSVAHLTEGPAEQPDIAGLLKCCSVVIWLIGEHVYRAKGLEPPHLVSA
jgi:hypothetical protein